MVKATGEFEGRPLVVFGLEPENVKRLQDGKPIMVDMASIGRPEMGHVLIVFGDSQDKIVEALGAGDLLRAAKGSA